MDLLDTFPVCPSRFISVTVCILCLNICSSLKTDDSVFVELGCCYYLKIIVAFIPIAILLTTARGQ